jgi:hypothetical protein
LEASSSIFVSKVNVSGLAVEMNLWLSSDAISNSESNCSSTFISNFCLTLHWQQGNWWKLWGPLLRIQLTVTGDVYETRMEDRDKKGTEIYWNLTFRNLILFPGTKEEEFVWIIEDQYREHR